MSFLSLSLFVQGQRTVYRLTLVKGYNTEEIEQYAKLVELGDPDFIEVKVGRSHTVERIGTSTIAFR